MDAVLVDALVQAVLALSPEERTYFNKNCEVKSNPKPKPLNMSTQGEKNGFSNKMNSCKPSFLPTFH